MMTDKKSRGISRRGFVGAGLGAGTMLGAGALTIRPGSVAVAQERVDELVIDLDGELESIHPALAYSAREWTVVHALYDAIVTIDAAGAVVPLAAETFESDDAQTWRVVMRSGVTFHDGSPVTAETLRASWQFLMASESTILELFAVIDDIEVVSELEATIVCSAPAPWLPAQIATWMVLVPPGYDDAAALEAPVGTGPYRWESGGSGQDIRLVRNEEYALGEVRGAALADAVAFRVVPEAATRVADVVSGTADIAVSIPNDFRAEVEGQGATVIDDPVVGSQWVRIATDSAPFDDPRVRRALNHAVDAEGIAAALMPPGTRRIATIFPDERAPGFDPELEPFAYDPDAARALLMEAGVDQGQPVVIQITAAARQDVAQAIAENLGDVGFDVSIEVSDPVSFNAGWPDPEAPVLRLATWSPLYEPHTLLGLVFSSEGFLSRFASDEVDALTADASEEPDPETRAAVLRELARVMVDDPPVIALWNLTATWAVGGDGEGFTPRGDERTTPIGDPGEV